MFRLLNQPYPIDDSPLRQLSKAAVIGLFVGLFLLVFQPFGLNLWETSYKAIKILGFGLVTFLVTAVNFVLLRLLFPALFAEDRWTVGRDMVAVMANILLIAVANRLYLGWLLGSTDSSEMSWSGMIIVTFVVGIFPVIGMILANYITQLKKYSNAAAAIPIHSHSAEIASPTDALSENLKQSADTTVTLVAENEKDTLSLSTDALLYIESSDNYCTVVHLKNTQVTKPLLRSSLSRLEKQIGRPHIVRCHRSYVVNLDRVERVTGNAQGYKLHLFSGQFAVPVARQYNETLIAELKAL
ncbi:LytTR family DNA-binding domain-containing protein [Spirosoma pollinicola]|uniref:LytTR family transcriptional regulator n=1 Tax=Spirosoma pollinicola TaxID=2057025 RepID=A0A2K8YZR9_9BACT|nr:LytTR family DNA-binding domain-containing protein [Spirosoma pollinicola]AUD03136.1 LytTR family transcriptional regulator [Spirosoma pollinicola]